MLSPEDDKIIQELEYFDGTIFRGEMERDDESLFMFKEGMGYIVRPKDSNFSYYESLKGNWVRGMLHGKRIEWVLNLNVFPKGYYCHSLGKSVPHEIKYIGEIRKGKLEGKGIYQNEDKARFTIT